jgi:cytochrome b pre-mRNA-processing protein 3
MSLLERLWRRNADLPAVALYKAVVERGRAPHWYLEGAVPDTIDGRFDMIAAVLTMVLLRIEADPEGAAPGAALAERFVDDMDGQLREIGIGDVVVGKHVSKMMGMLGGRLGAYRTGLAAGDLGPALVRNLYRGHAPDDAALAHVSTGLAALRTSLDGTPLDALLAGRLPQ